MTKNEFKMRALLAMCSGQVKLDSTEIKGMLQSADDLANSAKSIVHFDYDDDPVETPRRLLSNICEAVNKIDVQSYLLRDISAVLKEMSEALAKLTTDILDEDPNS